MSRAPAKLVAFLGPSLAEPDARTITRGACEVRPPARRGDVWRAVADGAKVIALIDGLFERVPSVWHKEILDALDSGVAVLGGSSMGALRAAELHRFGMVGVGTIFGWYASGECVDDGDVALVHADAEHAFRPLSLPQVNVRWNIQRAVRARVISRRVGERIIERSARIFYGERTWQDVFTHAHLDPRSNVRLAQWIPENFEDLKRIDAEACLRAALALANTQAPAPTRSARARPSSLVRRMRILDSRTHGAPASEMIDSLSEDGAELTAAGLRRSLIAGWAREAGVSVSGGALERALESWREGMGEASLDEALAASGVGRAELEDLLEDWLLETRVLRHAARIVSDGPSELEALVGEARLSGQWGSRGHE